MKRRNAIQTSIRVARKTWANLSREACMALAEITKQNNFSVAVGDLLYLNKHWYVTHTGPIRLARRKRYRGIHVEAVDSLCDSAANRFVDFGTLKWSTSAVCFGPPWHSKLLLWI